MNTTSISPQNLPSTQTRWVQFVANTFIAVVVTAAFGSAFATLFHEAMLPGAGKMLLMAGTGWILLLVLAQLRLTDTPRAAYIHRIGQLIRDGVLFLIPATLWIHFGIESEFDLPFALLSVGSSFSYMLIRHLRIVRQIQMPRHWNLIWLASLLGTAAAWFNVVCDASKFC